MSLFVLVALEMRRFVSTVSLLPFPVAGVAIGRHPPCPCHFCHTTSVE